MDILSAIFPRLRNDGIKRQRVFAASDLQQWMRGPGNPANVGRGYSGNRGLPSFPGAFIEVRRESIAKGWMVEAALILDPRRSIAAQKQKWMVSKLDTQIEQRFGLGNRFRITV